MRCGTRAGLRVGRARRVYEGQRYLTWIKGAHARPSRKAPMPQFPRQQTMLQALSTCTAHLLGRQALTPWPQFFGGSNVSINSIQYSCFASAFALSKPSILCPAFLVFPTISGNLLPARSKPRRLNYTGFRYGKSTAGPRKRLYLRTKARGTVCSLRTLCAGSGYEGRGPLFAPAVMDQAKYTGMGHCRRDCLGVCCLPGRLFLSRNMHAMRNPARLQLYLKFIAV